jgi:Methyltransferase domain
MNPPNAGVTTMDVTDARLTWEPVRMLLHQLDCGDLDSVAATIAELVPRFIGSSGFTRHFRLWESRGFHVTPVHFYSPIPDTAALPDDLWSRESDIAGVDMNDAAQLKLIDTFLRFQDEYNDLAQEPTDAPDRFYLKNPMFAGTDALVLYCLVRHFQPRSVIEVGSGFSTRLFVEAAGRNPQPADICCIDPHPDPIVKQSLPVRLIEQRVQDVSSSIFDRLESGDFLFIDSSHTVTPGGDVNHLLLEVLPKLRPGVIVHFHDIFLPRQQPREWVIDHLRFWCEQDLLHAFLAFNTAFEVLLANAYLGLRQLVKLREVFPRSEWWGGGSFWIRRVQPGGR